MSGPSEPSGVDRLARSVCLIVLDGWGLAEPGPGNAVSLADTPVFDALWREYPHTTLEASGEAVGLRTVLVMSSQTVMPLLFGALGATLGMTPVFLAMAAFLSLAGWNVRSAAARPRT